jgi:hypothetical protein
VIRRWFLFLLLASMNLGLVACSGVSANNLHNPPPPPGSNVSVAFNPTPVSGLFINTNTEFTAVVDNDPNKYGVDWSVTCNNKGNCGSLSAQHSQSGEAVTYSPPPALTGNTESVNIIAFASVDHTKNVVAPIALSAFANALNGTYVFQTTGVDASGLNYQLAGVLTLDGNGRIASGEQTMSSITGVLTTPVGQGSSYFVGADGRGSITLNTTDQSGQAVTEHFSITVVSLMKALIAGLDAPQSSVGTLELQTSTDMPTGGYAFVANGIDATATPIAIGGVANIDSPGIISGNGSLVDQDYNAAFFECGSPSGLTGTVTQPTPSSTGKVIFDLTTSTNCFGFAEFTGYIVDSTHIRLIETDGSNMTGGLAISQGSARGTYTNASLAGTYVYSVAGTDMASFLPATLTGAGFVTSDGLGSLTNGSTDFFLLGAFAEFREQHTGTYTVDTKGLGRFRLVFDHFVPTPQTNFRPKLTLYLTSPGAPALVLHAGGEELFTPAIGTGIAYPQGSPPFSFNGRYATSFTQQNGVENDGTGQMTAQPASNPPSLSGAVDDSASGVGTPTPLTDTFALPDTNGDFTGSFLGSNVAYYLVDSGHGFFAETDLVNPGSGQVAVGYFEVRTPVCDGCQ